MARKPSGRGFRATFLCLKTKQNNTTSTLTANHLKAPCTHATPLMSSSATLLYACAVGPKECVLRGTQPTHATLTAPQNLNSKTTIT